MFRLLGLPEDPDGRLFPCDTNNPYQHWRMLLKKTQKKAGVKPFTFHALRRAMADRLRRSGAPVDAYIRYMGHAAITGLRHYASVSMDDLHDMQVKAQESVRRRKPSSSAEEPEHE